MAVFKWIDQITLILPPTLVTGVRVGALALWLVLALFIGMAHWQKGEESAYQSEDRKQTMEGIEEQLNRERNLRKAPHVLLPELGDLPREYEHTNSRGHERRRYLERENTFLEGPSSATLLRADSPSGRESNSKAYMNDENLPLYIGEGSPAPAYAAQQSSYLPAGRRQNESNSRPLLPVDQGLERSLLEREKNIQTNSIPKDNVYSSSAAARNWRSALPLASEEKHEDYRNSQKAFPRAKDVGNLEKNHIEHYKASSTKEDIRGSLQSKEEIEDVSTLPLPASN